MGKCRFCGGKTENRGKNEAHRQKVRCTKCNRWDVPSKHPRTAKILLLDIETAYMEVKGVWNLKTDYIQPDRVTKDWSILCWGAKWLFEPKIMGEVVTPKEAINREEKSIIGGIWKLIDEADIVVWHNGNNFDGKRLNTKFLMNGYNPPSPYIAIDTLKVARETFDFTSNKLDQLGKRVLGLEGKMKMEMADWDACVGGDKKALDKMLRYCKRDVAPLLEDLYLVFLPWIKSHPNLAIYKEHNGDVCPKCESTHIAWNTQYATPQGLWEGFRCDTCGAVGRGTTKDRKIYSSYVKSA